jgi:hypothetical protein
MSVYGVVVDDEDIYYKLDLGAVEVMFFRGDGSITYPDGTSDFEVRYTPNTLAAKIDLNKIPTGVAQIHGIVYQDGEDAELGEYTIFDELKGALETLEFNFNDPEGDVRLEYQNTEHVSGEPEIDIISAELIDSEIFYTLSFVFREVPGKTEDFLYLIKLGDAEIRYTSGKGTIKYYNQEVETTQITLDSKSISAKFEKAKLVITTALFEISSWHSPSEFKEYKDTLIANLPAYLFFPGGNMNMEISLFQNNNIIMKLSGELPNTFSQDLRQRIDQHGDINSNVEVQEVLDYEALLKEEFTIYDFFEIQPYVDGIPGQGEIDFQFQNATGGITSQKPITQTIRGIWKFMIPIENEANITFRILRSIAEPPTLDALLFDFIFRDLKINLSAEYKYWFIQSNSLFPNYIVDYFNSELLVLEFPNFNYYELKTNLKVPEFGFIIVYNETLADLDKDEPKDDSGGFLPGFELIGLVVALVIIIVFISSKRSKK